MWERRTRAGASCTQSTHTRLHDVYRAFIRSRHAALYPQRPLPAAPSTRSALYPQRPLPAAPSTRSALYPQRRRLLRCASPCSPHPRRAA